MSKIDSVVNKILDGSNVRKTLFEAKDVNNCTLYIQYGDVYGTIKKVKVATKVYSVGNRQGVECACNPGNKVTVYCKLFDSCDSLFLSMGDDADNTIFEWKKGESFTFIVPEDADGEACFTIFNGAAASEETLDHFDEDGTVQTMYISADGWVSMIKDFKVS